MLVEFELRKQSLNVSRQNFLRRSSRINGQENGNEPAHNHCVAHRPKVDCGRPVLPNVGDHPDIALAAVDTVFLGLFLFGTSRVGEFLDKGFSFISIGNDLHHVLTQSTAHVQALEGIAKEKGKGWERRPTRLM